MGLLSRGKKRGDERACKHEQLDPRWDCMEDAGIVDRIDHYICRRCAARIKKPLAAAGD